MKKKIDSEKLLLAKTIYAKRFKTSPQQIYEILKLEIETHLRNYTDVEFKRFLEPIDNQDRSKTYLIEFITKDVNQKLLS